MEHDILALPTQLFSRGRSKLYIASKQCRFFRVGVVLVRTITVYSGMVPLVHLVLGAAQM